MMKSTSFNNMMLMRRRKLIMNLKLSHKNFVTRAAATMRVSCFANNDLYNESDSNNYRFFIFFSFPQLARLFMIFAFNSTQNYINFYAVDVAVLLGMKNRHKILRENISSHFYAINSSNLQLVD